MQAGETTLNKLLNTTRQFIVPIFQRNYSWESQQYEQLWLDILRAGSFSEGQNHFIGSIVYMDLGTPAGRPQQLLLIDGQQRLTTISILIYALKSYIKKYKVATDLISLAKLDNQFLYNLDEVAEDRYKLVLNVADKETYMRLIDDNLFTVSTPAKKIVECYQYFWSRIDEYFNLNNNLDNIYLGILKLNLVSISLTKDVDNPQLIFESMNSTGKDLSQMDLLRNYLLMGLSPDEQERLYNVYWKPLEDLFTVEAKTDIQENFIYFIRDYLTIKQDGTICKLNDVYEVFKRYCGDSELFHEDLLKDLYKYAKFYTAMDLLKESDKELYRYWQELKFFDIKAVYPFLLQIYCAYNKGQISKVDFIFTISLTINYLCRRAICGLATNSLGKVFANLYREIDFFSYRNSVIKAYIYKSDYKRFPTDYEVREHLQTKDMYHFSLKYYILLKIENFHHKEPIDLFSHRYTVEHILPQNIDDNIAWQEMLGDNWQEIHTLYVHTLGNLTLTGYNAEMGNKSFKYKVYSSIGFAQSHLKINRMISEYSVWNKQSIQWRTNKLTDVLLKLWEYPNLCYK